MKNNRYLFAFLHLIFLGAGISRASASYQVQEKQQLKNKKVICTLTYTFPKKLIEEREDNPIDQRITIIRKYEGAKISKLQLPQEDKIVLKHIDTDEEAKNIKELLEKSKEFLEQYDAYLHKEAGGGSSISSIKMTWSGSYSDYFKKAIIFYEQEQKLIPVGGIGFNHQPHGKGISELFLWKGAPKYLEKKVKNAKGVMCAAQKAFCIFHFYRKESKNSILAYSDIHNISSQNSCKRTGFKNTKRREKSNENCIQNEGKTCTYLIYELKKSELKVKFTLEKETTNKTELKSPFIALNAQKRKGNTDPSTTPYMKPSSQKKEPKSSAWIGYASMIILELSYLLIIGYFISPSEKKGGSLNKK
ncbi:MAG: hypothetical protein AAF770_00895 [Bacteroidota bacterium]